MTKICPTQGELTGVHIVLINFFYCVREVKINNFLGFRGNLKRNINPRKAFIKLIVSWIKN